MNRIEADAPGIFIEWVISNVCNYSCNYCPPELNDGSVRWPNRNNVDRFFDYVHTHVNSSTKLLLLSGAGEPTLWPELTSFIARLDDTYKVSISTNASRSIKWWKKFAENNKNKLHFLSLSVHLEYSDIEHVIKVSKILETNGIGVAVQILADKNKNTFEYIKSVYYSFVNKNLNINIELIPVRKLDGSSQYYSTEEIEFISNSAIKKVKSLQDREKIKNIPHFAIIDGEKKTPSDLRKIRSNNQHMFSGWKCMFGKHRLVILQDGRIVGAYCRTAKNNYYGNINDDSYNIFEKVVTCDTKYCTCMPDIRIPKWKE